MCYERDAEEEKSMSKNIKRQRLFWSRVSKTERFMRNTVLFQLKKAAEKDTGCYTVQDALDSFGAD